ncbi:hypothetical protein [Halorussus pelagicus]|uniref:hypothetical protein n=1 Tax=Halorussus pelagicus TaxID=2505977 RepID=UPI000FFB732F|nr:hypothetical protein [Halorussus pelagicus]
MKKKNKNMLYNSMSKRSLLKQMGLAGAGISAFPALSGNAAAASDFDIDIESVWDSIVDLALDQISVNPFSTSDVAEPQERKRKVKQQLETQMRSDFNGTTNSDGPSTQVTPTDIPFDICYWTDFGADGSKICVDSATPSYGSPDCDTMALPNLHYMSFALTSFDLKWDRDWSASWSANVWVGSDPQDGCLYTGMEAVDGTQLNQCAKVICPDDIIEAGASVATIAQSAFETALSAIEEWADKQGLWDWLLYVAAALIAIAIIIAISTGTITFSLPAAAALGVI